MLQQNCFPKSTDVQLLGLPGELRFLASRVCIRCLVCAVLQLGRLPEDALAHITARLLQGLVFMHSKHMVRPLQLCVCSCIHARDASQHTGCKGT
jgi:hypothetical protein